MSTTLSSPYLLPTTSRNGTVNTLGLTNSLCRVEQDKSIRYVAAENIQQLFEEPTPALMKLAGRYFKRWDKDAGVFVSNVRDEYPDD